MGVLDWLQEKLGGSTDAGSTGGSSNLKQRRPLQQLWICSCGHRYSGGAVCPRCSRDNSKDPTVDDKATKVLFIAKGVAVVVIVISGVATVIWLGSLLGGGVTATAVGIGLVGTGTATAGTDTETGAGGNSTGTKPKPPVIPLPDGPRSYHLYQGQVSWQGPVVVTNHNFGGSDILLVFEVAGNVAEFREAQIIIAGGEVKVGERFGPVDSGHWLNRSNRLTMKPELTTTVDSKSTSIAGTLDSHAQNRPQFAFKATRKRVLNSDEYSDGEGDVYRGIVNAAFAAKPPPARNLSPRQETPRGKPLVPQF